MDNKLKPWKDRVPGKDSWDESLLLHKAILNDHSGITIWRTTAKGYYTVEVWTRKGKDKDGFPMWSYNAERYSVGNDWEKAEAAYKQLVERHGGF